jgi:hypothetical protein
MSAAQQDMLAHHHVTHLSHSSNDMLAVQDAYTLTLRLQLHNMYQEIDTGLELTKFSAIPSMVHEKTLSGHVAPLHSVLASQKLPHCHSSKFDVVQGLDTHAWHAT